MREYAERAVRRGGVPRMPDTPERSRLVIVYSGEAE